MKRLLNQRLNLPAMLRHDESKAKNRWDSLRAMRWGREPILAVLLSSLLFALTCRVASPADQYEIVVPTSPESHVTALSFRRDGKVLGAAHIDGIINLWDPANGVMLRHLAGHQGIEIFALEFSPDNKVFASASADGKVNVWDLNSGQLLRTLADPTVKEDRNAATSLSFSSDGKLLATGYQFYGSEVGVRIWDVQAGTLVKTLKGNSNGVWSVKFFDRDRRLIAAGGLADKGAMSIRESDAYGQGEMHEVIVWDLQRNSPSIRWMSGHSKAIVSVAVSQDERLCVTGAEDGSLKTWNLATGTLVRSLRHQVRNASITKVLFGDAGDLIIAASQGGGRLGPESGQVLAWKIETGHLIQVIDQNGGVTALDRAPNSRMLVSASDGDFGAIRVWSPLGVQARSLKPRAGRAKPHMAAFTPDDSEVVVADNESVRRWDTRSGRTKGMLAKTSQTEANFLLSSDGKILASGSGKGGRRYMDTINLWSLETGNGVAEPFNGDRS